MVGWWDEDKIGDRLTVRVELARRLVERGREIDPLPEPSCLPQVSPP